MCVCVCACVLCMCVCGRVDVVEQRRTESIEKILSPPSKKTKSTVWSMESVRMHLFVV